MKITFQKTERSTLVHPIHCPECGERVRNVVLLPGCKVDGLGVKCKRCSRLQRLSADDTTDSIVQTK